jgi:sigma-E factor negative regulatory protein RseA
MVMDKFQVDPKPEEISLLMDGELEAGRIDSVCAGMREPGCMATWVCYHVIGDALRGGAGGSIRGFAEHFHTTLEAEPTILAPRRRPAPAAIALAAAATVAAVSLVSWVALTTMPGGDARVTAAIATAKQASAVRAADARPAVDNEYVLVHQEYSPTTAIQGVRPYLRAVAAGEPDARP